MKIAIIAHSFHPIAEPFAGGLEKLTYLLCKELMQLGQEVDLYAHRDSDPSFNLVPLPELAYAKLSESTHEGYPTTEDLAQTELYSQVVHQISEQDYDIVHNHSLNDLPIILGNHIEAPFITTFHTPPFPILQNGAAAVRPKVKQTFTLVSESLGKVWSPFIDRWLVVHNGIDISQWNFSAAPSEDVAFWAGRICKEKAPDQAIAASLKAGIKIRFAGPLSDPDYFVEKVEPLLHLKGVEYLGHLSQEEMKTEFEKASFSFFTSTWEEPFGLVIVESLACGTPVIGYRIGAAPEILTDKTGILVEPQNTSELALAATQYLKLDRRACRKLVEQNFSSQAMALKYLKLYHELIAQPHRKTLNAAAI